MFLRWLQSKRDTGHVLQLVALAARSERADVEVKRALVGGLDPRSGASRVALKLLEAQRPSFEQDRACRLLKACINNAPVAPIDSDHRELFLREEALGRAAIRDSFEVLTKVEPRLGDLLGEALRKEKDGAVSILDELGILVGPGVQHEDPLIRSQLALSLTMHYLQLVAGEAKGSDASEAYFGAGRRLVARRIV